MYEINPFLWYGTKYKFMCNYYVFFNYDHFLFLNLVVILQKTLISILQIGLNIEFGRKETGDCLEIPLDHLWF